jgi:hypothetical protein
MSATLQEPEDAGQDASANDEGFDVNDDEVVDVSDQETTDVIEAAKGVRFEIKKASVDVWREKDGSVDQWYTKKLALEVAVVDGIDIDGEMKYAGKRFFPRLCYKVNYADYPQKFASDWWKNKSKADFKEFMGKAMGLDVSQIRINDAFLVELEGQEFVANILKREIEKKVDGEYVGTGEYENQLRYFKKAT